MAIRSVIKGTLTAHIDVIWTTPTEVLGVIPVLLYYFFLTVWEQSKKNYTTIYTIIGSNPRAPVGVVQITSTYHTLTVLHMGV